MKMQKSTGALLMMLGLLMEVLSCAAYGQTTLYPTNGVPESFSTDPFSNNRWTRGDADMKWRSDVKIIWVERNVQSTATTKESFSINPAGYNPLTLKFSCQNDKVGTNQCWIKATVNTTDKVTVYYTGGKVPQTVDLTNFPDPITSLTFTFQGVAQSTEVPYPAARLDDVSIVGTPRAFTATFDAQGGSAPSPASKSVTYNAAYGTLATTSRTGYAFNGWYTAPTGGTLVTAATIVTTASNHTLYAQWTANSYTVGYDADPKPGGVLGGPASILHAGAGAGDTIGFTVDANPGWSLTGVDASSGVVNHTGSNEYTLSGVTGPASKSDRGLEALASQADTKATKPRVIVSTDIGGDPDDYQSMVHYLIYADRFDTEGLIASPGTGRKDNILSVINAYETDYPSLASNSSEYPSPATLRPLAKQGATVASPAAGYSSATEGSNWIISCADKADSRPLYVLVWGAITDVAQAVHDAPRIKSKIRVYFIASWNTSQDKNARNYLYNSHSDLWWIECNSTFRGMYVGGTQTGDLGNLTFIAQHVRYHGALGDFFYSKKTDLKMGDSPSVLYMLNGDPGAPTTQHWGGMFRTTGHGTHYWTDLTDTQYREGSYDGAKTVNVWRTSFLRDWQARMDWAGGEIHPVEVNLVNNPSFEVDPIPPTWPHYASSVTGWTVGGGSILNDSGGPFYTSALGSIPDGAKLYGNQGAGILSQPISGLYHGRSFRLVFHVNNRSGRPPMDLTATLGSQTLYGPTTIPTNSGVFHYVSLGPVQYNSAWGNTLTFHFTNPQGDSTLLLDNVQILSAQGHTVTYQSDPAGGGSVSGPGSIATGGTLGDSISMTVTPNPGFLLSTVVASNGNVLPAGGNQYSLSGVTANTTVTAFFIEGQPEGEGTVEGQPEGEGTVEGQPEGEGTIEGQPEGEGTIEGQPEGEGTLEGQPEGEGTVEGQPEGEGTVEGQPEGEGTAEGQPEGEGSAEGQLEGEGESEFDVTVTATFSPIHYTVEYMALPAEGGNVSGSITIDHDGTLADEITIVVTVNPGWKNTGVNATHGVIVHDTGDNYTLSGVTANTTVTAYFEEDGGEGAIEGEGLEEGQAEGEGAIEGDGESEGEPLIIEVCSATAPILITGEPDSTVISILEIPDNFSIVDIDVELDVSHPCVPDLRFELIAPDATTVMLIEHIGMGGILTGEGCPTQFLDTVLDDESPTSLPDGMEPYTGAFNIAHPTAGLLADFDGLLASGVWVLRVTNGFDLTGTLEDWCLRVTGEYLSEGEGQPEGVVEGEGQPEGVVEGEGQPEGTVEGEGQPEGTVEGEGVAEGTPDGEGQTEGTAEGEGQGSGSHTADQDNNGRINLTELLRVIQFFNIKGFQCVTPPAISEDGYLPGPGQDHGCVTHQSDYNPQDWQINLTELLRLIQFFNTGGYHACPDENTEDGFCPGPA
jgi:uncharacterized repeat protein (TIGR02543 family)